jgi:Xaa-Pro aminopeptidase
MIEMSEYAKRRQALMQSLGSSSIIILPSAKEVARNNDATFPFRQSSDFYYLTGFEEPNAVLVLLPKRKEGEYLIFNQVRDRETEIWDGPRLGQHGALKHLRADDAFPIQALESILPDLMIGRESIHFPLGYDKNFDNLLIRCLQQLRGKVRSGVKAPVALVDITAHLHEMRLFKSPAEIAVMQKAIDISARAHVRAMEACTPGMMEYQLEAEIVHEFHCHGARSPAYSSIVGSGPNTCILHYVTNNKKIKDGELVLIDAGAEYQNYASDITRTFPANGRFTKEQAAIYNLVLEAQNKAIQSIKPGAPFSKAQEIVVKVITKGLIDLGILKGKLDDLIKKRAYSPFYMHRSGHWLGLDVHDAGAYQENQKSRPLKPGMVLTVEPGIYISSDNPRVHKRWHNIGVRIEDDVLVTRTGCDVMSKHIPKQIKDIEAIMAK